MKAGDLVKYKIIPHDKFQHWVGLLTSSGHNYPGRPVTMWVMWGTGDSGPTGSGRLIEEWADELEVIR
jgi:hypothetical protein